MTHYEHLIATAEEKYIPISILFELNHRCHLNCVHCYLEDNHDQEKVAAQLTYEEVCSIIDQIKEAGCFILTLSGGEIFLRRDTLSIARYARSRGLGVRLFTSGTLLTEKGVSGIAACDPLSVEVSLYSADNPALHDTITRLPGSHARTLKGIALLREAGVPVVIKTPLMHEIFSEYPRIREYAEGVGASYLCDPTITPQTDGGLSPTSCRLLQEELVQLYADPLLKKKGHVQKRLPDPEDSPCSIGKRSCVISPWGDVYPCMEVRQSAGNLREQSFAEIWNSSPLLRRLRAIRAKDLPVCSGCDKFFYCHRCNGIAEKENGDFFGPSTWSCQLAAAQEEAAFIPLSPISRT